MNRHQSDTNFQSIQYQIVATRRQAYDNLIWQTPVISLTAQAFLFQIALDKEYSGPQSPDKKCLNLR